jgi:hypothetical protein
MVKDHISITEDLMLNLPIKTKEGSKQIQTENFSDSISKETPYNNHYHSKS